jgi:hypothetical protein
MPLLHPSGGLFYHLRAWRWRYTRWQPFHSEIARWLEAWQPQAAHLVLIGPSGGYGLNARFLARFQRITVLEPDPLARHLLRKGFADFKFEFADSAGLAQQDGPANLAQCYPEAAFLFCNLLGQKLVGQGGGHHRQAWLSALQAALQGREWASWHDLASSTRRPDRFGQLALPQAEPLDDLLARFWIGGELEIHDHDCAGLLPESPRHYAIWQLAPGWFHLVEWVRSQLATESVGKSGFVK